MKLSIYLIKEDYRRFDQIFDDYDQDRKIDLNITGAARAHFYYRPTKTGQPNWVGLFSEFSEIMELNLSNASTAAVLVIGVAGRLFALTYGYGRTLLKPGCYEERFGLLVTINTINPDSIRSIDKTTFDELTLQTREQSSKAGEHYMFGVDIERDVVRAITGKARSEEFGKRMSGMDNLNVVVNGSLSDIPGLMARYLNRFEDESYKETTEWAWIDHISQVRDVSVIEGLNDLLVARMKNEENESLWLAPPEIIDWDRTDGYRYNQRMRGEHVDDMDIEEYMNTLDDEISLEMLNRKKIFAVDSDSGRTYTGWSVFKCIYCEIEQDGNTYILSSGTWYRVAGDFVTDINERIERIPSSNISLPDYSHDSETEYNIDVHERNRSNLALMDRKPIPFGGGRSSIEFCDLYSNDRKFIHVKRYGSSSTFSHLFNQGVNSAIYFVSEGAFRSLVNERLPRQFKIPDARRRVSPEDYEIVYAIVSKTEEAIVKLPFFSRVSLSNAHRELRSYGYNVSLLKIQNVR